MMRNSIAEFVLMLKLGIWSGGEVAGLGYVGKLRDIQNEMEFMGMEELGNGVEYKSDVRDRQLDVVFAVEDIYSGRKLYYETTLSATAKKGLSRATRSYLMESIRSSRAGRKRSMSSSTFRNMPLGG